LALVVAVMFIINIGLCIALVYHSKHAVVKNVVVNHNNITAMGDSTAIAAGTAEWSSVCVAAGGSCFDETSFFKNTASRGSGVIYKIDEKKHEAYFITCQHVIDGHDKFFILLPSQLKPVKAELVGQSAHYDIAVLKITDITGMDSCTEIQIYDSTYLATGEGVFAVGNPLSGGPSVTRGVISRINTMIKVEGNTFLSREIQTDAAINPGNSGGGLFNNEGKFIGLVNAKLNNAQSGNTTINVEDTAYAIPSKLVISVVDSIMRNNGSPTCINLGAEFERNIDYGRENIDVGNNKYIKAYKVQVDSINSGSIASGKLKSGDWIKYFIFEDVNGNKHEVQMYDIYSFEDVKFSIKPNSTIVFMVDRAHNSELVPISIIASSFSTY
jgi:S1-C subfamily serine protease